MRRNKKKRIYDFLIIVLMILLIYVCFQIYSDYHSIHKVQKDLESIKKACVSESVNPKDKKKVHRKVDWKHLQKINNNCIAWIKIPGNVVDYPILKTNSYNYYLSHDINNNYSQYGTLFFDYRLYDKTLKSKNLIIYGHNMGHYTDVMFSSLMKYKQSNYASKHRTVYLYTVNREEPYVYKIVSVREVNKSSDAYKIEFTKKEFKNWQKKMMDDSIIGLSEEKEIKGNQQILTLSTCTYDSNRLVLHCVKTK